MGTAERNQRSEDRRRRAELKATEEASWIARVNAGNGNIFSDNCAGSDDNLITDRDRKDSGIRSDAHTIAKFGWPPELRFSGRATGDEQIINKHRTMGDETVVPNRDQIADERVGLNPAPLANGCSVLCLNERSDEAIISDRAVIEINGLHDGDLLAKCNIDNSDCSKLRDSFRRAQRSRPTKTSHLFFYEICACCPFELKGRAR